VKLRTEGPPCEGAVHREIGHRGRTRQGRQRRLRDHPRRPARLLEKGARPVSDRRGDRRARRRV